MLTACIFLSFKRWLRQSHGKFDVWVKEKMSIQLFIIFMKGKVLLRCWGTRDWGHSSAVEPELWKVWAHSPVPKIKTVRQGSKYSDLYTMHQDWLCTVVCHLRFSYECQGKAHRHWNKQWKRCRYNAANVTSFLFAWWKRMGCNGSLVLQSISWKTCATESPGLRISM